MLVRKLIIFIYYFSGGRVCSSAIEDDIHSAREAGGRRLHVQGNHAADRNRKRHLEHGRPTSGKCLYAEEQEHY